jgi:hypothetical protein
LRNGVGEAGALEAVLAKLMDSLPCELYHGASHLISHLKFVSSSTEYAGNDSFGMGYALQNEARGFCIRNAVVALLLQQGAVNVLYKTGPSHRKF